VGFAEATTEYRAQLLIWVLRAYAFPAEWTLSLDSPLEAGEFRAAAIAAGEGDELTRALDGAFN
jgi:hypothetical protein